LQQIDKAVVADTIKLGLAGLLCLQAALLAVELSLSLDEIKYNAYSYTAPDDATGLYLLMVGINLLIISASLVLGIYWVKASLPKIRFFLPLSIIAALYGGMSLLIPVAVFLSWLLIKSGRR